MPSGLRDLHTCMGSTPARQTTHLPNNESRFYATDICAYQNTVDYRFLCSLFLSMSFLSFITHIFILFINYEAYRLSKCINHCLRVIYVMRESCLRSINSANILITECDDKGFMVFSLFLI